MQNFLKKSGLTFFLAYSQLFLTKVNWPNTDQDGFAMETKKSTSEIEYNFFTKAYKAYNDGQDEFPNEIEDLYWELMDSMNVNEELIRQLEDDLNLLKKEHHELNEPSSELGKNFHKPYCYTQCDEKLSIQQVRKVR